MRQDALTAPAPRRVIGSARRLWRGESQVDRDVRRLIQYGFVAFLAAVAVILGTWGFALGRSGHPVWNLNDLYRALQLFPLHSGDVEHVHWQLQVARFSAPAVDAVTILAALSILASGLTSRARLLQMSNHVIVCGGGVHGSRLAANLARAFDVVVIDSDSQAPRFQEPHNRRELHLVLNAVQRDALRQAGLSRASCLVAVTGDDFTNSQIVSTARGLAGEEGVREEFAVFAQVEDPFLARFLEGGRSKSELTHPPEGDGPRSCVDGASSRVAAPVGNASPVVNVFSANAIAAGVLFGEGRLGGREGSCLLADLERDDRPHLLLVGDHGLIESVVLAELRRLRAQSETDAVAAVKGLPFRITVIGPKAVERVDALVRRWFPEPQLLELDARDLHSDDEASILADRWFRGRHRPGHAVVVCEDELDGIALTLAVSSCLGSGVPVTRVTTQPRSELDRHLQDRATQSGQLGPISVESIADLAWGDESSALENTSQRARLVEALQIESHITASDARVRADQVLGRSNITMRFDAAPRISPSSRPIVSALLQGTAEAGDRHPVPLSALVRAGLMIELEAHGNLLHAAQTLSSAGDHVSSFAAWCEYVRHAPEPALLDPGRAPTDKLGGAIVGLRAATLGALSRLDGLGRDLRDGQAAPRIAIFAGGSDDMSGRATDQVTKLLDRALLGYGGMILTCGAHNGLGAVIRNVAKRHQVPVRTYATAAPDAARTSRAVGCDLIEMWADILCSGLSAPNVRVVAAATGPNATAGVLLGRALGAEVVWLDPAGENVISIEDRLPGGGGGVFELPNDPMTLRAFLVWLPASELSPRLRQSIATYLHQAYRSRQWSEKPPGDPALSPWETLIPTLQRSNLAAADDIPNKLAVIRKRIEPGGVRLTLRREELELLAEMEHGRFTYERLSAGWRLGQRQIPHMMSPYLEPWTQLEEKQKQWDRDAVLSIDPALQRSGHGVVDL